MSDSCRSTPLETSPKGLWTFYFIYVIIAGHQTNPAVGPWGQGGAKTDPRRNGRNPSGREIRLRQQRDGVRSVPHVKQQDQQQRNF